MKNEIRKTKNKKQKKENKNIGTVCEKEFHRLQMIVYSGSC